MSNKNYYLYSVGDSSVGLSESCDKVEIKIIDNHIVISDQHHYISPENDLEIKKIIEKEYDGSFDYILNEDEFEQLKLGHYNPPTFEKRSFKNPIEFNIGHNAIIRGTYIVGTIDSYPKQDPISPKVMLAFGNGRFIKIDASKIEEIPINVSKFEQPKHCALCNIWFDYDSAVSLPLLCRECFNAWLDADKLLCEHESIEIDGRALGYCQFYQEHWLVCKKCGELMDHYNSGD